MKRFGKALVAVTAAVALTGIGSAVSAQQPPDLHCDDHNAPENDKFEGASGTEELEGVIFDWDGTSLTIENTNDVTVIVTWCAKGGVNFIDGDQTTGIVTTTLGPGESETFTFDQDISYLVVYDIEKEEPEDEEEEEEEEEKEEEREVEPAPVVVAEPVFTG